MRNPSEQRPETTPQRYTSPRTHYTRAILPLVGAATVGFFVIVTIQTGGSQSSSWLSDPSHSCPQTKPPSPVFRDLFSWVAANITLLYQQYKKSNQGRAGGKVLQHSNDPGSGFDLICGAIVIQDGGCRHAGPLRVVRLWAYDSPFIGCTSTSVWSMSLLNLIC